MLRYPVTLEHDDNGTILVGFPDVPEAHTFGDTEKEALAHAPDALLTALDTYITDKRPVPWPSPMATHLKESGQHWVGIPPLDQAKLELYQAMRDRGVTKYRLAKRLGWHTPQVDRVLTLRYRSRFDQIQQALAELGLVLNINVEPTEDNLNKAPVH